MGRFVGFAESVGDAMTFKVLCDDSSKIIFCSNVHSAELPGTKNLKLCPERGYEAVFIQSKTEDFITPEVPIPPLPGYHPRELIG